LAELDRVVHEPARLRILTVLSGVEMADFHFLLTVLGLTKGNLSTHMDRLERAGYVRVDKRFEGKLPKTEYRVTETGRLALQEYWREIDSIRAFVPVR
jgi:DNA-binding transcriptional ArsR family regulator